MFPSKICIAVIHSSLSLFKLNQFAQSTEYAMNQDLYIDCFEKTRELCGTLVSCANHYQLTVEFLASSETFSQTDYYMFRDISKTLVRPYTFLDEQSGKLHFISYPAPAIGVQGTYLDGTYNCLLTPFRSRKTFTPTRIIIYHKSLKFIGRPRVFTY